MSRIAVLGSTGSIGTPTLEVLAAESGHEVASLAAGRCSDVLIEQITTWRPGRVVVATPEAAADV